MSNTFLSADWENLIMANYAVNPDLLEPYLPKGVELDCHQNKTYVSRTLIAIFACNLLEDKMKFRPGIVLR